MCNFKLLCIVQGVDWRDKSNWGCNGGMNPYLEYMNDGVSLVHEDSLAAVHNAYQRC